MNHADNAAIGALTTHAVRRAAAVGARPAMCHDGSPQKKVQAFSREAYQKLMNPAANTTTAIAAADDNENGTDIAAMEKVNVESALKVLNLIGMFYVFADLLKRTLTLARPTMMGLCSRWRDSLRKQEFFISGGNITRCYYELMSAAAGIARHFLDTFRASHEFSNGQREIRKLCDWIDEIAERAPIVAQLQFTVRLSVLVWGLRSAMRAGSIKACTRVIKHHIEICGATGGDNYLRILTEFLVLFKTCPERDLVVLEELMFTDVGSCYLPNDELIEWFHNFEKQIAKIPRNTRSWFVQMRRTAVMLYSRHPSKNLGLYDGRGGAPIGGIDLLADIAARTILYLKESVPFATETHWASVHSRATKNHPVSAVGPRSKDEPDDPAWAGVDGSHITSNVVSQKRFGAAVAMVDARDATVFSGRNSIKIERPRIARRAMTVEARDAEARVQIEKMRANTLEVVCKPRLCSVPYIKETLQLYARTLTASSGGAAMTSALRSVDLSDRAWMPLMSSGKEALARALVQWRQADSSWCFATENGSGNSNASNPVDTTHATLQSEHELWRAARARNAACSRVVPDLKRERQTAETRLVLHPDTAKSKLEEKSKVNVPLANTRDPFAWLKKNAKTDCDTPFDDDAEAMRAFGELVTDMAFDAIENCSHVTRADDMRLQRKQHREEHTDELRADREKLKLDGSAKSRWDDLEPCAAAVGLCEAHYSRLPNDGGAAPAQGRRSARSRAGATTARRGTTGGGRPVHNSSMSSSKHSSPRR